MQFNVWDLINVLVKQDLSVTCVSRVFTCRGDMLGKHEVRLYQLFYDLLNFRVARAAECQPLFVHVYRYWIMVYLCLMKTYLWAFKSMQPNSSNNQRKFGSHPAKIFSESKAIVIQYCFWFIKLYVKHAIIWFFHLYQD